MMTLLSCTPDTAKPAVEGVRGRSCCTNRFGARRWRRGVVGRQAMARGGRRRSATTARSRHVGTRKRVYESTVIMSPSRPPSLPSCCPHIAVPLSPPAACGLLFGCRTESVSGRAICTTAYGQRGRMSIEFEPLFAFAAARQLMPMTPCATLKIALLSAPIISSSCDKSHGPSAKCHKVQTVLAPLSSPRFSAAVGDPAANAPRFCGAARYRTARAAARRRCRRVRRDCP